MDRRAAIGGKTSLLEKPPVNVMIGAFAALCRRAGDLVVALEFMPYSGVPDLATGWEIVATADRPMAMSTEAGPTLTA